MNQFCVLLIITCLAALYGQKNWRQTSVHLPADAEYFPLFAPLLPFVNSTSRNTQTSSLPSNLIYIISWEETELVLQRVKQIPQNYKILVIILQPSLEVRIPDAIAKSLQNKNVNIISAGSLLDSFELSYEEPLFQSMNLYQLLFTLSLSQLRQVFLPLAMKYVMKTQQFQVQRICSLDPSTSAAAFHDQFLSKQTDKPILMLSSNSMDDDLKTLLNPEGVKDRQFSAVCLLHLHDQDTFSKLDKYWDFQMKWMRKKANELSSIRNSALRRILIHPFLQIDHPHHHSTEQRSDLSDAKPSHNYSMRFFDDGKLIPPIAREYFLYLQQQDEDTFTEMFLNPFKVKTDGSKVLSLREFMCQAESRSSRVPRILKYLHTRDLNLQKQFPDITAAEQQQKLLQWFNSVGASAYQLECTAAKIHKKTTLDDTAAIQQRELILSALKQSMKQQQQDVTRSEATTKKTTFHIYGFVRTESSFGETTRSTIRSIFSQYPQNRIILHQMPIPYYRSTDFSIERFLGLSVDPRESSDDEGSSILIVHLLPNYFSQQNINISSSSSSLNAAIKAAGLQELQRKKQGRTAHRIGVVACDKHWDDERIIAELVDEIWTSSALCKDYYSKKFHGKIPVTKIPPSVDLQWFVDDVGTTESGASGHDDGPMIQRLFRTETDEESFVYLVSFDYMELNERNPFAILQALEIAFPKTKDSPSITVVFKSTNGFVVEGKELLRQQDGIKKTYNRFNIIFINDYLSRAEMVQLLSSVHCYVSLHRILGYSFTIFEAMYLGKPVIATAYSTHMDYVTQETAFLVPYQLEDEDGIFVAEPSLEQAAKALRRVHDEYDDALAVAKKGRDVVLKLLSSDQVGLAMKQRILQTEKTSANK